MADGPIIFSNEEEEIKAVSNTNLDNDSLDLLETQEWRILRYPQELGSSPDLKNYVVFYINVRERDTSEEYEKKIGTIARSRSDLNKQNRTITTEARTLAPVAFVAGASAIANTLPEPYKSVAALSAGLAIGLGSGVKEIKEGSAAVFNTIVQAATGSSAKIQQVRLKKMIALHMNNKPRAEYNASYEDTDMGLLSGMIRQMGQGNDVFTQVGNITDMASAKAAFASGSSPLAALGFKNIKEAEILGTGSIGENLSRSLAVTTNPFKEQLFRGMGFRTFAFDYVFLPKSKNEALMVRNIVNTFKYYMHPGMNPSNPYWLTYPAEFDISFHSYGQPNEYLHKISSCVLTNLDVDFGSDNDFMTFKPDDESDDVNRTSQRSGYPTEITLKLQFTELEVLTRNRIGEGY
jgi:hypothetical protein